MSRSRRSRQLRALERELHVDLFQRGRGPLRPTRTGRRSARWHATWSGASGEGARSKSQVSLRFVAPFATIVTSAPFAAVHGVAHLIVDAIECDPASVFERTLFAGSDFGVSTVAHPQAGASRKLAGLGLSAHFPEEHPLQREPLVLMDRPHYARLVFVAAVAAEGLQLVSAVEMNSSFMALAHAAAGRGAAVVTNRPAFVCERCGTGTATSRYDRRIMRAGTPPTTRLT